MRFKELERIIKKDGWYFERLAHALQASREEGKNHDTESPRRPRPKNR